MGIPDGPNSALPGDPHNQDRAKFSVSSLPDPRGRAFFYSSQNNRILLNFQNSDGSWDYPTSLVAIASEEATSSTTVAVGVVVRNAAQIFHNARETGVTSNYSWLMYFIRQNASVPGAGVPCVAFSNDGITWSENFVRVQAGPVGTALDCESTSDSSPKLEAIAGSLVDSTFYLAGMEGNFGTIASNTTGRTLTYLYTSTPAAPHSLTELGEFPTTGIVAPTNPGGDEELFFINLDFSYDPMTDRALLARSIPFPYKSSTSFGENSSPCKIGVGQQNVCPIGWPTYPMRSQVYSRLVAGNILGLLSGTWRLDLDVGQSTGWAVQGSTMTSCTLFPASETFQTTIGVDTDSINFFKDENGILQRETSGSGTLYFGGYTDRQLSCDSSLTAGDTFLDGLLYSYTVELPIFTDGFEANTTSRWSAVVP